MQGEKEQAISPIAFEGTTTLPSRFAFDFAFDFSFDFAFGFGFGFARSAPANSLRCKSCSSSKKEYKPKPM